MDAVEATNNAPIQSLPKSSISSFIFVIPLFFQNFLSFVINVEDSLNKGIPIKNFSLVDNSSDSQTFTPVDQKCIFFF